MLSRLARDTLINRLTVLRTGLVIVAVVCVVDSLIVRNEQVDSARNNDRARRRRRPRNGGRRMPNTANARDEENRSIPSTVRDERTTASQAPVNPQSGSEVVESTPEAGSSTFTPQQSEISAESAVPWCEFTEPNDASNSLPTRAPYSDEDIAGIAGPRSPEIRTSPFSVGELDTTALAAAQPPFEYDDDVAGPSTPHVTSPELSDPHWFDLQLCSVVFGTGATEDASLIQSPTRSSSSDEFEITSPTSPQSRVDHVWSWPTGDFGFGSLPPTEPTSPFSELSAFSGDAEDTFSLPSRSDSDGSLLSYRISEDNTPLSFSLSEILGTRDQHVGLDVAGSSSESDDDDVSIDSTWDDVDMS